MTDRLNRRAFGGLSLAGMGAALTGCAVTDPLDEARRPMGDFRLGFNIVVADNAKQVPPSRNADPEELKVAMKAEVDRRFGQYDGPTPYHIALSIDGYALAPPGIPVVLTPKSILVVTANLWSAEPQEKILGPEQILVFEGADTLFIGSGLMKDKDQQIETLTRNMAFKVQSWMLKSPEIFGLG